jgi:polyhydroxyalkanoate synthesis regulator phasin
MPQPKKSGSAGRKPAARKPAGARAAASSRAAAKPEPGTRKPAARKPAAGKPAARKPAGATPEESARHLAALRELLTRGVVITGDVIQDTMDEAVRRGRMTREDAEELVHSLLSIGRRQTADVLAELEGLVGRGRTTADRSAEETRKRTRARVRSVAAAARRAPGTDKALQQVDRARRAAGVGTAFPVIGYDDLTAAQVVERLGDLDPGELRMVRDYERRNANRKSVLAAIEKRLG